MPQKPEYRNVRHGVCFVPARIMAVAEGYAMVRRSGCMPFVTSAKAWDLATACDADGTPINRSTDNE